MKMLRSSLSVLLVSLLFMAGCKPKDADIRTSIEEKLKTNASTSPTTVMVDDGVATLGGQLENEQARSESEKMAKDVKGVKSVVNNITVTPPPAPVTEPVVIAADDAITTGVKDATKDFPSVVATVDNGVVTLNGTITKAQLPKLMQSISSLKPKKIENKLTVN